MAPYCEPTVGSVSSALKVLVLLMVTLRQWSFRTSAWSTTSSAGPCWGSFGNVWTGYKGCPWGHGPGAAVEDTSLCCATFKGTAGQTIEILGKFPRTEYIVSTNYFMLKPWVRESQRRSHAAPSWLKYRQCDPSRRLLTCSMSCLRTPEVPRNHARLRCADRNNVVYILHFD
jgi:hypothetical protein